MRTEIFRLWYSKKILIALLGLFILNGVCFWYMNKEAETNSAQDRQAQMEYINSYHAYVEEVIEEADRVTRNPMFAFSSGEFSKQNAENIAEAYERIEGVKVESGNDTPVAQFMSYSLLRYISLIMVFLVVFTLIREQKKGIGQIIYASAKGRFLLGARRCGLVVLMTAIIHAINFIVALLLSVVMFGGGVGFGRSVQSVSLFADVTYPISIAGYLVRYYLVSTLAIAIIGILAWAIMSLISNTILATLIISVFGILEFAWVGDITYQSNFKYLKCINVLEYMKTEEYLYKYYDINCFDHAVNLLLFIKIGMLILLLFCAVLGVFAFVKRPSQGVKLKLFRSKGYLYRLQEIYNLVLAELHKMLICSKGIFVIAITVIVAIGIVDQKHIIYTEEEAYVNAFYDKYSGILDEEVYAFVEEQQAYITATYEEYARVYELYMADEIEKLEYYIVEAKFRESQIAEKGLVVIAAEIERAETIEKERGIKIHIFNNSGYNKLLGNVGHETQRGIMVVSLISLVLILSGCFKFEENNQSVYMIRAAVRGRQELMRAKKVSAIIITVFVFVLLYGVQLYYISQQYGMPDIFAPVQSIAILQSFPLKINILTYIVGVFIIRAGLYVLIADLLVNLSVLLDQRILIIAFAGAVVIPILVSLHSISYFEILNVNGMAMGQGDWLKESVKLVVLLAGYLVSKKLAGKKWCE